MHSEQHGRDNMKRKRSTGIHIVFEMCIQFLDVPSLVNRRRIFLVICFRFAIYACSTTPRLGSISRARPIAVDMIEVMFASGYVAWNVGGRHVNVGLEGRVRDNIAKNRAYVDAWLASSCRFVGWKHIETEIPYHVAPKHVLRHVSSLAVALPLLQVCLHSKSPTAAVPVLRFVSRSNAG